MMILTRIKQLMDELNEAYKREDFADMANIIQLELLDKVKEVASEGKDA